jgi:hypothetical protein
MKIQTPVLWSVLFVAPFIALPLQATVLTFNVCGGGTGTAVEGNRCRYATINQAYGDRVTGPSMNGGRMQYGQEGEGWTPNVTVTYGPDGSAIRGWDNNYAGLWTVIWTEDRSGQLSIRMTADPGYQVSFFGLRIGGYIFNEGPWPLVIGSLSLTDSSGATLWSQSNTPITKSGPLLLSFTEPYRSANGGWLEFMMDVRNLPVGNANRESIGIDLVRFGQSVSPSSGIEKALIENPEPGTLGLMLLGAGGLAMQSLRRRRAGR